MTAGQPLASQEQRDTGEPNKSMQETRERKDELRFRPERIYLVGMPGSGKSSSGRVLARLLDYEFEDLDSAIELKAGMSVQEIFLSRGEEFFRELETQCLEVAHTRSQLVLATGGGAVLRNMDSMLRNGLVLWLDIPVHELISRISAGADRRPMFRHLSPTNLEMKVWELYRQRQSLYALAHLRFLGEQSLLDWGQRVLFLPRVGSNYKVKGGEQSLR
jgi:shikimate kinase